MPTKDRKISNRIFPNLQKSPDGIRKTIHSLSGLEYLQAVKNGKIIPPPVMKLVGYQIAEIEDGRAVFDLFVKESHCNPVGIVQGGLLGTVLDASMASAIHTKLPAGMSYPTLELKINFIRPVSIEVQRVLCESKVIHVGRQIGLAEGRVLDEKGNLYAHGTTTCLIFFPKR